MVKRWRKKKKKDEPEVKPGRHVHDLRHTGTVHKGDGEVIVHFKCKDCPYRTTA